MLFALLAIAVLVGLVTWLKLNPFIALLISSLTLGAMVVIDSGAITMAEVASVSASSCSPSAWA